MSFRSFLASRVSQRLTDQNRLIRQHEKLEKQRENQGGARVIDYFHDAGDPYSHLAAQFIPDLVKRYDIELHPHLVGPPPAWAAPDRERLVAYSRRDAEMLAGKAGLDFRDPGEQPEANRIMQAESALAASIHAGTFVDEAAGIGRALWQGDALPSPPDADPAALKDAGDARRAALGQYLGGTFHFQGEWFWGVDRLHYLEKRLQASAKKPVAQAPLFSPPTLLETRPAGAVNTELHYYLSFRSPYTYIAAERVKALADAYDAALKLRFVLPMVMRGMQVPRMKGIYILKDTAREAGRLGIPFGKVADPVGKPVERGYSILPWAVSEGRGFDFALSFLRGVWAEGIDAGSDGGLKQIVDRAGLDWKQARQLVGNDEWRPEAEANRAEMMSLGLWGVPSFRVGDTAAWGQDRLWLIEDALKQRLAGAS